jgi:hypothetical protein
MIDNLRKRYEQLQGLLNTPANQSGGLLGNISQGALLGSAIYGQGVQGKDPFAALFPAVAQTAQMQQLLTPKQKDRKMVKDVEGRQRYADTGELVFPDVKSPAKKSFRQLSDSEKQSRGLPIDKQFQIGADDKVMQIGGSGTSVTVNTPPPETAEEKALGQVFGEEFKEINKAGNLANVNDQKLEVLMNLTQSENLNSGKFGDLRTEVQKFAEEFGFDPGLQDVTIAEVVGGVSGGLVLDGLQAFPGSISNGERDFVKSITAGMTTTKEGNKYLLQINKRQNELAKEFSNVANDWISRNGGLSKKDKKLGSWGSYKKKWHEANPLINPEMKTKLTDLSKTVDTEFSNNIVTRKNGKKYVYINGGYEELTY